MVCAAVEGVAAKFGGDVGVPELDVEPGVFSLADAEGTGR
jgi:hypothetical protein